MGRLIWFGAGVAVGVVASFAVATWIVAGDSFEHQDDGGGEVRADLDRAYVIPLVDAAYPGGGPT